MADTHIHLAALAHARGAEDAARTHLREARGLFSSMRVPRGVERTEKLAREMGLRLGTPDDA